jgi:hypothetical protein
MQDNQNKVIDWIRSGMDYNEGIGLLVDLTRKPIYSDQFTGREKSMTDKLAYEICKAAMVADYTNWKAFIQKVKDGSETEIIEGNHSLTDDFLLVDLPEVIAGEQDQEKVFNPATARTENAPSISDSESLETKPLAQYPPVIRRSIHEYAALFQERSKLHTVMTDMPESNAESVCAKRAELFDLIKSISARLEILYEAKKAFDEKGIVPEENEVFPPVGKEEAEPDLASLDEVSLKKQKKNLQSSNSKDQTMLDYQSKERTEVKTPMPNSPKRAKIEMRIGERNKKIEEIETLLLNYAGKE